MPSELRALAEVAADKRTKKSAEVDAHVKDCETAITPGVAGPIKFADDSADVRLEQAGTEHDEQETEEECVKRRHRKNEVAGHDDNAADKYCSLCAQ